MRDRAGAVAAITAEDATSAQSRLGGGIAVAVSLPMISFQGRDCVGYSITCDLLPRPSKQEIRLSTDWAIAMKTSFRASWYLLSSSRAVRTAPVAVSVTVEGPLAVQGVIIEALS